MPPDFRLPHIDIRPLSQAHNFSGPSAGGSSAPRIREEHGRRIQAELDAALAIADEVRPVDERLAPPSGSFIEVELSRGTKPDALDQKSIGLRSGAAKVEGNSDRSVLLYVPDTARPALRQIIEDYLTGDLTERGQQPPNKAKVEAIEAFRAARLERFWTDDPLALPQAPHASIWWALWCWKGAEAEVDLACVTLEIRAAPRERRLYFPEIVVIPVFANRATIELLLFATGGVSELRRASDSPAFFVDEARGEQHAWVDDLAERVRWPGNDAPAVCVLDTGCNRGHALIEPALSAVDQHTLNAAWGVDDHDADGHGTAMAGLALHSDLTAPLADTAERTLHHRLESVKILPPQPFDAADPKSYGPLTQAAIALPEITNPARSRIFCMAITNEDVAGSKPSGWSAAIDQAAAGVMPGDEAEAPKRLIVLATGNVPPIIEYPRMQPQTDYPAEDPAQAWNAISVGAYTDLTEIRDPGYETWNPMAAAGDLSPHSRTSVNWPNGSPFKPEIVMEGGNRAVSAARTEAVTLGSLSLLSTGRDAAAPLVSFEATSAAAAQAARLAARLAGDHPEFWPETIRALMIHSAEWTPPMLAALTAQVSKKDRYNLIRQFGYGVPTYERATASAESDLALFSQAEIQPFKLEGNRKFSECHYYSLPIPRGMLEALENEVVELKVTLSYFIEPNPGLSANIDPQRYQSHGLRFDLRRKAESEDIFRRRVNAAERENPRIGPPIEPDDDRWMLGQQSVSCGSLHCDVWTGPAIELVGRETLCVRPVAGWARDRASREICDATRRYSLIVSLKARNPEIDLYTPISTRVEALIPIEV